MNIKGKMNTNYEHNSEGCPVHSKNGGSRYAISNCGTSSR